MTALLDDKARALIDGTNAATVATLNPDGRPQTSVVFVGRDGDAVLFSTIKGRRKTRNMTRDPRISLLVVDASNKGSYVEVRGTVQITDDPEKTLLTRMYEKYLGTPPPPEPDAERVIVRLTPEMVYRFPPS
jgi:PPOX class probable F420-dependent enzyme